MSKKTVWITGGCFGIGRALVTEFLNAGYVVCVSDIQDIPKEYGKKKHLHYYKVDVSQEEQVISCYKEILSTVNQVDVLVNNAAIFIGGMPIYEMKHTDLKRLFDVNICGYFYTIRAALPDMQARKKGSIINVASTQACKGFDGCTAYSATKGAVVSMTRQLAVEFGPDNVRINSISPGTIDTPLNDRIIEEQGEHLIELWKKLHPLNRIGTPEEVAKTAMFLASDESSFITGADIKVDGGQTCAPRLCI